MLIFQVVDPLKSDTDMALSMGYTQLATLLHREIVNHTKLKHNKHNTKP
jgi:hypothetical protein